MHDSSPPPIVKPRVPLGSRPSAIVMLHFSAKSAPEPERPVLFREFFERLGVRYDATPVDDPIEIDLTLQGLPGIQLLSGKLQGARYRRTRESGDPTEDVGFVVNAGGPHLISQRGREVVLGDGDATLVSLSEPLDTTHRPPGHMLVLRVPKPQLASRLADVQDCVLRRIPYGTPALGLLKDYVNVAWQEPTLADGDLQRVLVPHLYDLMAVAIGTTRDAVYMAQGRGLRAARLHAIKQDIATHLDQADLSVSALAARLHCTPRFVQRLFETEGTTFTEYVLAQRLSRAHRMLTDPRRAGEKISAIAYDCGFGDVSYLNRAFRRRYGAAPSDVRAQARQAAHRTPAAPAVHHAVPAVYARHEFPAGDPERKAVRPEV
jgi:AraC-like DNA-binding protein